LRARAEGLPLRVHLAGDGELRGEYERFIRGHGLEDGVRLHGTVRRIDAFYRALDLFVLTSHREGHPNTVLEALAAGVAVACTPVGDLPGFLRHGENGFLFPDGDLEGLWRIVRDRRSDAGIFRRVAERGRREARERFDLSVMVEAYTRLYEEGVGEGA
ncbi:MAG: glycosyltransferase family 4 protein, partial [Planctomycetota bacterium]